jgi:hypothetical protein
MDKVKTYKKIVQDLIREIDAMIPKTQGVDNQIIIDNERGHYLLYSVGWEKQEWVYGSYVHLDIKPDGKVWLQHDGTSLKIAEELQRRGVIKNDLVIGFKSPVTRANMEGYAVG